MTKTIKINCHVWWIRIGVSLWVLTTIGLGYSLYYTYGLTYPHNAAQIADHCKDLPGNWKTECIAQNSAPQDPSGLYLSLFLNACNIIGMWLVINYNFKFIEIECISDFVSSIDTSTKYTDEFISNEEYFKQKESS